MLKSNTTLQEWHIDFNFEDRICTFPLWQKFFDLLCNEDTIDATYNSNHTFSHIDFHFHIRAYQEDDEDDEEGEEYFTADDDMPLELQFLLQMNRNPNKAAVARRKIINVHFDLESSTQKLHGLNLVLEGMPHLLSWLGKESSELALMYDFVRSTPSLFEQGCTSAVPGRKRMKLSLH
jgi:hypothetical protein